LSKIPKIKVRGSTASFKTSYGMKTDLVKLAKAYSNWGDVPTRIGDIKAGEIALLCRMYLHELKCRKVLEYQIQKLEAKQK
jgi:hypothetical protein